MEIFCRVPTLNLDAGSELPAINRDDLSRDSRLKSLEKNFRLHHCKKACMLTNSPTILGFENSFTLKFLVIYLYIISL